MISWFETSCPLIALLRLAHAIYSLSDAIICGQLSWSVSLSARAQSYSPKVEHRQTSPYGLKVLLRTRCSFATTSQLAHLHMLCHMLARVQPLPPPVPSTSYGAVTPSHMLQNSFAVEVHIQLAKLHQSCAACKSYNLYMQVAKLPSSHICCKPCHCYVLMGAFGT